MTLVDKIVKIGNWLFKVLKYSMLFAIMANIVFLTISIISYYILIEYAGINFEISALMTGLISVIIIVVLDFKKFHFRKKVHQHLINSTD